MGKHGQRGGNDIRVYPIPDPVTGCHVWPGTVNQDGYGLLGREGRSMMAHRWYWIQANGEIPSGLVIDHLCRNRRCCNPEHMEVVTIRENVLRGVSPNVLLSRANRCKRGHEFTDANTIQKSDGGRQCRTCQREANRLSYQRRRANATV